MSRLLIIDNYDSFTYNLVELIRTLKYPEFDICLNDQLNPGKVVEYDKILISPGPGLPENAGVCCEIIKQYYTTKSILGICLGHQAIAQVFGGSLYQLKQVYHGKQCSVEVLDRGEPLFKGIAGSFKAGLYHSWAVSKDSLPECLTPTAISEDSVLMSFRHKQYELAGIQFHPESILTPAGRIIMENWLFG